LTVLGVVIIAGGLAAALAATPGPSPRAHALVAHHHGASRKLPLAPLGNRAEQLGAKVADLPAATTAPAAAPAALISAPPLASRENFAFVPYWTLGQAPTFDLDGLSTLAYFSIGVNPNGTLAESGPGWNGYQSQDLADLITRAHAEGERVVLTVNDFGQSSLDTLTSSPTASATLSAALIPLLQAKNLDGVNIDFEGSGSRDQAGLTALVASLSGALRAADPHWQITMDTYASSAGDAGGFYNIPALAPAVDAFFVMAYELNLGGTASAASPLTSGMFSDLTTLQQYTSAVPAAKVILGTPFFGIDWPTSNGTLAATSTGPATDIADAEVQVPTKPLYWDPVTESGWTSYLTGSQWHESFFESPYALFQVAHLAAQFGVRGVGIWALGMESEGPQMVAALDGFAPAGGPGGTGPQATSSSATVSGATPDTTAPATTSPTAATTTTKPAGGSTTTTVKGATTTTTTTVAVVTTALYNGKTVTLTPVSSGGIDTLSPSGIISDFTSTNPAFACLDGKSLAVYQYGLLSGKLVAVASTPSDCVKQQFTFPG
jgi:spore germination protein YaaH